MKSQDLETTNHAKTVKTYWLEHDELPVVAFIIVDTQSKQALKKSLTSFQKVNYVNKNIYVIDISNDSVHKPMAKQFGAKYFAAPESGNGIYEKLAQVKGSGATIALTAGIIVKKNILKSLIPYIDQSDAVGTTLIVDGKKVDHAVQDSLVGIRKAELTNEQTSDSIHTIPVSLASVDGRLFGDSERLFVERGLRPDKAPRKHVAILRSVLALSIVIIVLASTAGILAINGWSWSTNKMALVKTSAPTSEANTQKPAASTDNAATTEKTADQKTTENNNSESTSKPAPTTLTHPDVGPSTATLNVQAGDSMSTLITRYINDMHDAFPDLTLARLGYAQDFLMNKYGYSPLPAGTQTFTITNEDVLGAWNKANIADNNEAFWADYALRAGIRP